MHIQTLFMSMLWILVWDQQGFPIVGCQIMWVGDKCMYKSMWGTRALNKSIDMGCHTSSADINDNHKWKPCTKHRKNCETALTPGIYSKYSRYSSIVKFGRNCENLVNPHQFGLEVSAEFITMMYGQTQNFSSIAI